MSKQLQKEFDSNFMSNQKLLASVANLLLDHLCDLYSPREVVELLAGAGYTEADCKTLGFDDSTISSVFK